MTTIWPAARIKKLRKAFGESQDVFCRRLGVTSGALQFWEQGKGEPSRPVQIIMEGLEREASDEPDVGDAGTEEKNLASAG